MDRLSDLCARFNNQFSNDGVRSFFHFDAEAGNGSMTEDAMPVRDDMRDARIVEDRRLSSDHRERASQLVKLGHSPHFPVATNAGPSAEMIDGFAWTAGENDTPGAKLRSPIGNERDLFLVRDQED